MNYIDKKQLLYSLLSLANSIVWAQVLIKSIGYSYELIAVILLFYSNLTEYLLHRQFMSMASIGKLLLVLLILSSLLSVGGFFFGAIGVSIVLLLLMGRMVYKAVTSDYYKSSMRLVQEDVNKIVKGDKK